MAKVEVRVGRWAGRGVCEHMDLPAAAAATNGSPTSTGLALPPLNPTSIDDGKSGELSRLPGVWQRHGERVTMLLQGHKRGGGDT